MKIFRVIFWNNHTHTDSTEVYANSPEEAIRLVETAFPGKVFDAEAKEV